MEVRSTHELDYPSVLSVLDEWWGGRPMSHLLPRLFFQHFQDTSFIVTQDRRLIGFLIGFVSQSRTNEAYIHFVGVHPQFRKDGVARHLYNLFFKAVRERGCNLVRCITSPVNKGSIAFHTNMGFTIEPGDSVEDGIPVHVDYDAVGASRVLFVKAI